MGTESAICVPIVAVMLSTRAPLPASGGPASWPASEEPLVLPLALPLAAPLLLPEVEAGVLLFVLLHAAAHPSAIVPTREQARRERGLVIGSASLLRREGGGESIKAAGAPLARAPIRGQRRLPYAA